MKHILLALLLFVNTLLFSQIDSEHLKVGDSAPAIVGNDQLGNTINSDEILKTQKILLVFYRGNWCPYCRKHLKTLQNHLQDLTNKGYKVLVVSPEKPEKTIETSKKVKASFSIIHDTDTKIMSDYKVAFNVNKESVPNYLGFTKKKIAEYNAENTNILPVPATYIIDQNGKISFVHYDPDYTKRFEIAAILNL